MKGENFIYVKDDVLTEETCQNIIKGFEYIDSCDQVYDRGYTPAESVKDSSCNMGMLRQVGQVVLGTLYSGDITKLLQTEINTCLYEYFRKYETGMFGILGDSSPRPTSLGDYPAILTGAKLQKTRPSEGYHIWHAEATSLLYKSRVISYILYLNDISEGGETEFIHLSERVAPKAGRMLIFPAGWTHTHRGNPPLVEDKYIATGWMEYSV